MHGIYFYLQPLFMLLLVFAGATALYMCLFKAHREDTGAARKAVSGVLSGVASATVWAISYSHCYLGW